MPTSQEQAENCSLWLVPLPDSALSKAISRVITETLPPLFPEAPPPKFIPHLTLTASTIPPPPSSPQEWLDKLQLPNFGQVDLSIDIGQLQIGQTFFQRITKLCDGGTMLSDLAASCRAAGTGEGIEEARKWIQENYRPHVSLMYSDLSWGTVTARSRQILKAFNAIQEDRLYASGAEIWLVPTFKPVAEWEPLARRSFEKVSWRCDI